jgi:hypothetical protein
VAVTASPGRQRSVSRRERPRRWRAGRWAAACGASRHSLFSPDSVHLDRRNADRLAGAARRSGDAELGHPRNGTTSELSLIGGRPRRDWRSIRSIVRKCLVYRSVDRHGVAGRGIRCRSRTRGLRCRRLGQVAADSGQDRSLRMPSWDVSLRRSRAPASPRDWVPKSAGPAPSNASKQNSAGMTIENTRWHRFSDDARLGRARAWLAHRGYRCAR